MKKNIRVVRDKDVQMKVKLEYSQNKPSHICLVAVLSQDGPSLVKFGTLYLLRSIDKKLFGMLSRFSLMSSADCLNACLFNAQNYFQIHTSIPAANFKIKFCTLQYSAYIRNTFTTTTHIFFLDTARTKHHSYAKESLFISLLKLTLNKQK